MIKTSEDLSALVILVVLFCPAVYGLGSALLKVVFGAIDFHNESFRSGIILHAINALISPGIPAHLLYVDMHTGHGSVGSLLSLPLIPVTWVLFFIGQKRLVKAGSGTLPPPPNSPAGEEVCSPQDSSEQRRKEGGSET